MNVCGCNPPCGLPTCTGCGEDHGGNDHGNGVHLCRDCDLEWLLAGMQCSGCKLMRYRTDSVGSFDCGAMGAYLWGGRCVCDPKPPSMREVER